MSVYDRHQGDLRPLVARHFSSPFEREEALQEIWLQVHRSAPSYDPVRGELRPWLRTLATNRCREILRMRGRRPPPGAEIGEDLVSAQAGPDVVAREHRVKAAISTHISTLEPEEAAVFRLALLEEQPTEAVAQRLGISPRRAKYLKLKLLERAATAPALRAALEDALSP